MQDKEKISAVIPTYNRANDLVKAVKSVLDQTYPVFEILVCDDGSTDNSKELIEQLNDKRVKWISCGKNGGPAIPRNRGIMQSKGEWIAFLDSDDQWLPGKIEKQVAALVRSNAKAACSNAFRIYKGRNEGTYLAYPKATIGFADLLKTNSVICSSVLVNKEFLLGVSTFPTEKKFVAIEDYALWLRLSTQTDFIFLNEGLLNYSDTAETSLRTNYTDGWLISEIVFTDFKHWIDRKGIELGHQDKKRLKEATKNAVDKGKERWWPRYRTKIVNRLKKLF